MVFSDQIGVWIDYIGTLLGFATQMCVIMVKVNVDKIKFKFTLINLNCLANCRSTWCFGTQMLLIKVKVTVGSVANIRH